MARKSLRKLLLSLSVATVLTFSWSGSVIADGDEVAALEARVAELESLVHQLLANQQTSAVTVQMVEEKATEVAIVQEAEFAQAAGFNETSAAAALKTHQDARWQKRLTNIITNLVDSSRPMSSIVTIVVAPIPVQAGIFIFPGTIPVGDGDGESYLDFHVKESRINFKSTHNLDNGAKIGTFIEMDFQLPPGGNERVSNSFNPRVRHAFVTYNKWLVGQTWMTFFNVGALPENLDFVGPAESTIFGRQPMIRYTTGSWQFAAENPETTITPYGGGGRIVADDNTVPDLVVRYNMKGDWGTFTVAGTVP